MNLYNYAGEKIQYAHSCEGKTLVMFGDSIANPSGGETLGVTQKPGWWTGLYYATKTCLYLGFGAIDNRGYSGSNIYWNNGTYGGENAGISRLHAWLQEVENEEVDPNNCVVTITFGSNQVLSKIGTINDEMSDTYTENQTLYSAMKYFITKLRDVQKDYPVFSFGFVLPPYQNTFVIDSTRDVSAARQAMLNILTTNDWMCPYCDMWTESGLNPTILPDQVHPSNEQSQYLYFKPYCDFVRKISL